MVHFSSSCSVIVVAFADIGPSGNFIVSASNAHQAAIFYALHWGI